MIVPNFKNIFSKDSLRGFTLIEILVGLTVIGSLFGYGFVSYRDFTRRQALATFGKGIQGDIRLAQANALSGIKPPLGSCDDTYVLDTYGFEVMAADEYRIFAECSKVGVTTTIETKDIILPSGLTLNTPAVNPIKFKVLGDGNSIPSGQTVSIIVTQVGTNATYTISVTDGGEVK